MLSLLQALGKALETFRFEWPWALLLLLLIPLGWVLYAKSRRKRIQQLALHFSYASVAARLQQPMPLWKRVFYPVSISLLMGCLILSMARPTITSRIPTQSADLMLVLDISLSMLADDIRPTRIEAAKTAAIRFVNSLPRGMRVGLEVFAGNTYVLTPPTAQHQDVTAYLEALRPEDLKPRTEIGSAIHTALQTLKATSPPPSTGTNNASSSSTPNKPESSGTASENNAPNASPSTTTGESAANPDKSAVNSDQKTPNAPHKPDQVIVLLSDGDSHEGYPWTQAVEDAKQAHVTIHTIGIGTLEGDTITYQGLTLPVSFDETTLRRIAELAGGSYFRVFKEQDFRTVYEKIQARTVHYEERDLDLSFLLAGLALGILLGVLGMSNRLRL